MILLVGRKGVLSRAIQDQFSSENIHIVGSEISCKWASSNLNYEISDYINSLKEKPKFILNASGILDPNTPLKELLEINYYLPRKLEGFAHKNNIKLITFGTIMENFDDMSKSNPYVFSKKQYSDYLLQTNHIKSNALHLQIHTWYGGASLQPFMFLGQMYSAIQKKEIFHMSQGAQLREYHHIFDDLSALKYLLSINASGVFQINHGETVSLKTVAEYVFSEFQLSDLLQIGSLPQPILENFQIKFSPSSAFGNENFRLTLPGIVDYFRLLASKSQ